MPTHVWHSWGETPPRRVLWRFWPRVPTPPPGVGTLGRLRGHEATRPEASRATTLYMTRRYDHRGGCLPQTLARVCQQSVPTECANRASLGLALSGAKEGRPATNLPATTDKLYGYASCRACKPAQGIPSSRSSCFAMHLPELPLPAPRSRRSPLSPAKSKPEVAGTPSRSRSFATRIRILSGIRDWASGIRQWPKAAQSRCLRMHRMGQPPNRAANRLGLSPRKTRSLVDRSHPGAFCPMPRPAEKPERNRLKCIPCYGMFFGHEPAFQERVLPRLWR